MGDIRGCMTCDDDKEVGGDENVTDRIGRVVGRDLGGILDDVVFSMNCNEGGREFDE